MGAKIGEVTHYFGNIQVAVLTLSADLKVSDQIHFHGASTDFIQEVTSMQVDHENIEAASAGSDVAMKVKDRVRVGDEVLKANG